MADVYPMLAPQDSESPWTIYEASFFLLPAPDPDSKANDVLRYRRYEQDDDGEWIIADVVIRRENPDAHL